MARININEFVKFKLTNYGKDLLANSRERIECDTCLDEYRAQIWMVMKIFGPHFCNGTQAIVIGNTLVLGDANEHV